MQCKHLPNALKINVNLYIYANTIHNLNHKRRPKSTSKKGIEIGKQCSCELIQITFILAATTTSCVIRESKQDLKGEKDKL